MSSPISPTQPMPGMRIVECHHAGTMAKLQGGIECTVRAVLESKGILFDNWAIMRDNSRRIMLQPEENWSSSPFALSQVHCIVRSSKSSSKAEWSESGRHVVLIRQVCSLPWVGQWEMILPSVCVRDRIWTKLAKWIIKEKRG